MAVEDAVCFLTGPFQCDQKRVTQILERRRDGVVGRRGEDNTQWANHGMALIGRKGCEALAGTDEAPGGLGMALLLGQELASQPAIGGADQRHVRGDGGDVSPGAWSGELLVYAIERSGHIGVER